MTTPNPILLERAHPTKPRDCPSDMDLRFCGLPAGHCDTDGVLTDHEHTTNDGAEYIWPNTARDPQ